MTHQIIQAEDLTPQPWRNGGGQTRELLTWPNANDWQLRISRADIERDGPFSAFPGVQRWFAVLEGAGVVLHMPDSPRSLRAGDAPFAFDGSSAPGCTLVAGPTQDLNLMVQRGHGTMLPVEATPWSADFQMRGIYAVQGGCWSDGAQTLELPAHSLLWIERASQAAWTFTGSPAYWIGFTPAEQP